MNTDRAASLANWITRLWPEVTHDENKVSRYLQIRVRQTVQHVNTQDERHGGQNESHVHGCHQNHVTVQLARKSFSF